MAADRHHQHLLALSAFILRMRQLSKTNRTWWPTIDLASWGEGDRKPSGVGAPFVVSCYTGPEW